jgi:hypothetical protein
MREWLRDSWAPLALFAAVLSVWLYFFGVVAPGLHGG